MLVPSVSGFAAGALRTTAGALHTPPESVAFMMPQSKRTHEAQTTRSPAGETAGLTSLSELALTSTSGPDGLEMRPTMISPGEPFTNATVSPPRAVAPAEVPEPIWIVLWLTTS